MKNHLKILTPCLKKKMLKILLVDLLLSNSTVTIAQNVQNMKPVQNCTDFIFCTFNAVIHV